MLFSSKPIRIKYLAKPLCRPNKMYWIYVKGHWKECVSVWRVRTILCYWFGRVERSMSSLPKHTMQSAASYHTTACKLYLSTDLIWRITHARWGSAGSPLRHLIDQSGLMVSNETLAFWPTEPSYFLATLEPICPVGCPSGTVWIQYLALRPIHVLELYLTRMSDPAAAIWCNILWQEHWLTVNVLNGRDFSVTQLCCTGNSG